MRGRRTDERRHAHEERLGQDGLEQPLSLEQRDVGDRLAVEPEQVGRDEGVPLAALEGLERQRLELRGLGLVVPAVDVRVVLHAAAEDAGTRNGGRSIFAATGKAALAGPQRPRS